MVRKHWVAYIYEIEKTMTYISFIVEPRDLKFGMHVVLKKHCFISWNLQIVHITHTFWFFRRLKRVGCVLSTCRSELDLFLYIWYHTVRTQSGLSPCGSICCLFFLYCDTLKKLYESHRHYHIKNNFALDSKNIMKKLISLKKYIF